MLHESEEYRLAPVMVYSGNLSKNWRKFRLRLKYYLEGAFAKSSLTDE